MNEENKKRALILKKSRENVNLTLQEVSEKLKKYNESVSAATLQRYESGEISRIPINRINALSEIYKTTPGYLLNLKDEKNIRNPITLKPSGNIKISANRIKQLFDKKQIKFDDERISNAISKVSPLGYNSPDWSWLVESKKEYVEVTEEELKSLSNFFRINPEWLKGENTTEINIAQNDDKKNIEDYFNYLLKNNSPEVLRGIIGIIESAYSFLLQNNLDIKIEEDKKLEFQNTKTIRYAMSGQPEKDNNEKLEELKRKRREEREKNGQ